MSECKVAMVAYDGDAKHLHKAGLVGKPSTIKESAKATLAEVRQGPGSLFGRIRIGVGIAKTGPIGATKAPQFMALLSELALERLHHNPLPYAADLVFADGVDMEPPDPAPEGADADTVAAARQRARAYLTGELRPGQLKWLLAQIAELRDRTAAQLPAKRAAKAAKAALYKGPCKKGWGVRPLQER